MKRTRETTITINMMNITMNITMSIIMSTITSTIMNTNMSMDIITNMNISMIIMDPAPKREGNLQ